MVMVGGRSDLSRDDKVDVARPYLPLCGLVVHLLRAWGQVLGFNFEV